nr:hypothetical protein [Tanacetum cinerariifolium]
MVKISFDLNEPKDNSNTDKAAQNGRTRKSLTLEIHHDGCFTPTPSRSYVGGHVSSVNVVDIDEFCLHDLKDMVVKLGYGVPDLTYYQFLIPRLGLDYGLHPLNVDADVLEMAKYVKDYKIILVYVEHGSSIFVTPKRRVAIAVDNHLRKGPIEIDSTPDVNRNLTPTCHKNLTKEWEQVSYKSLSIGEVMKNLSKKQPASSVEGLIVVESANDPFEDLDEILDAYANTEKITEDEITGKQMVGHIGKFKEVEVDANNESEEESDTEGDYTSGSDSEDSDYDPKHDEVFDDHEHIVEDVHEDDLDVIDYDSFGSDLDDRIDSEKRIQLRELRRIGKQKNKGPNKRKLIMIKNDKEMVRVRCEGTISALVPYVATDTDMGKNKFSQTKGGPVIRENNISDKRNILGKDKTLQGKGKKVNKPKKKENTHALGQCLLHTLMKADERAVQDQMQKQFDVGVSKMKAFRAKIIAIDKMTGSFREQYSLLREYAQELINQNPSTTVRIDVQQEPNSESLARTFRRVYVCLEALKQGFRACDREILGLDGCFMLGPWPGQILITVEVDANNEIYPVAYAIVEVESMASGCWFLNLLGEDLGIEANFNYIFISDRQKRLIQAIASVFSSAEHRAKCDLLLNFCEVFNRQLVDGRDQPIIICLEYIREYLMKRIVVVQKVITKTVRPLTPVTALFDAIKRLLSTLFNGMEVFYIKKWELNGIPCKHVVAAIYNMYENLMGVAIPKQWVHVAYRLETCAHVYPFKVNPCKLYRKGKSIKCGKCGNVGHKRKGCKGQGGASQASARKVSGQQLVQGVPQVKLLVLVNLVQHQAQQTKDQLSIVQV